MADGIYILANDVVYDQLIALLNSLEVNASQFPICIIPYDHRLDKVRQAIQDREQVQIFEDTDCIAKWEDFSAQVWKTHPVAQTTWQQAESFKVHRLGMHRRFCGFDGPFERFIYLDADILVLNSLESIFHQLDECDWVVYDFQYKDPSHVYNLESENLFGIFDQARIESEIFCAGMYASKRGLFNTEQIDWLIAQLKQGESEILYMPGPDQSVLNYMVMRSGIPVYNFSHHLPAKQRTGCCVTSPHFEMRDHVLYDRGNRLTYLHYIGVPSTAFTQVCLGENVDFPYRELFLHYRYWKTPEQYPQFIAKPKPYNASPGLRQRILNKLGFPHSRI